MASKVFEHPFDLTKVRLQAQVLDSTARFDGPIDCLVKTWRREGIRGLYRVCTTVFLCQPGIESFFHRAFPCQLPAQWQRMHHFSCPTMSFRTSFDGRHPNPYPNRCRCRSSLWRVLELELLPASSCTSQSQYSMQTIDISVEELRWNSSSARCRSRC
jgi:hypothetical protein